MSGHALSDQTVVGVLAIAGAVLALRLHPNAGTSTLVDSGSPTYQATQRYHERFGDDAVIVLVRGKLTNLVLTGDILRLIGLEGCIAGHPPANVTPRGGAAGPCAQFAKTKPVQVV